MVKYLILGILIFSQTALADCRTNVLNEQIQKLRPMKKHKSRKLAKIVSRVGNYYKIRCQLLLAHLSAESDFNQNAVGLVGEVSIAQIDYHQWQKIVERKKKNLSLKKLKTSTFYAVSFMGYILKGLKKRYGKKDPFWFTRYNSSHPLYRMEYLSRLELRLKKIKAVDDIIDYKHKQLMLKKLVYKYGWKRIISIYTRLEPLEEILRKWHKRFNPDYEKWWAKQQKLKEKKKKLNKKAFIK